MKINYDNYYHVINHDKSEYEIYNGSKLGSIDRQRGCPVAQSVKLWTCDWKVAGMNPGLERSCGTILIFSALCAIAVF